jgi:hypothetical protein
MAYNTVSFKTLPYDPLRDFTAVASVCSQGPQSLSVNSEVPVHSVPELIAYAKANRGKYSIAFDVTAGAAGVVEERDLGGLIPDMLAVGVREELDDAGQGLARLADLQVLLLEGRGQLRRKDVGVGFAEQAGLVGHAAALGEGEVGHRETPGQVLGEEHHPGEVIEDRPQALRAHVAHPVRAGVWRFHTKQARGLSAGFHPILMGRKACGAPSPSAGCLSH